jgi:hypothetical protein
LFFFIGGGVGWVGVGRVKYIFLSLRRQLRCLAEGKNIMYVLQNPATPAISQNKILLLLPYPKTNLAVYTCDFSYESVYDSVYDLLPIVSCKGFFTFFLGGNV